MAQSNSWEKSYKFSVVNKLSSLNEKAKSIIGFLVEMELKKLKTLEAMMQAKKNG